MTHECERCERRFDSKMALGVHKGRSHTEPWTDKVTLRGLYIDERLNTREIADELGCAVGTVSRWLNKHDIEKPYKDEETLRRLYVEEDMTEIEIAKELGCGSGTVHRWLKKFGIATRQPVHKVIGSNVSGHYNHIWHRKDGVCIGVRVHRLVAYAHGKLDAADIFDEDIHVHHKNGNPWINSPENLEVLTDTEHMKHHFGRGES